MQSISYLLNTQYCTSIRVGSHVAMGIHVSYSSIAIIGALSRTTISIGPILEQYPAGTARVWDMYPVSNIDTCPGVPGVGIGGIGNEFGQGYRT